MKADNCNQDSRTSIDSSCNVPMHSGAAITNDKQRDARRSARSAVTNHHHTDHHVEDDNRKHFNNGHSFVSINSLKTETMQHLKSDQERMVYTEQGRQEQNHHHNKNGDDAIFTTSSTNNNKDDDTKSNATKQHSNKINTNGISDGDQDKKLKRLLRNRKTAQIRRNQTKEQFEVMQMQRNLLIFNNENLKREIVVLKNFRSKLQAIIKQHKRKCDQQQQEQVKHAKQQQHQVQQQHQEYQRQFVPSTAPFPFQQNIIIQQPFPNCTTSNNYNFLMPPLGNAPPIPAIQGQQQQSDQLHLQVQQQMQQQKQQLQRLLQQQHQQLQHDHTHQIPSDSTVRSQQQHINQVQDLNSINASLRGGVERTTAGQTPAMISSNSHTITTATATSTSTGINAPSLTSLSQSQSQMQQRSPYSFLMNEEEESRQQQLKFLVGNLVASSSDTSAVRFNETSYQMQENNIDGTIFEKSDKK